jgi:hypothetical protein
MTTPPAWLTDLIELIMEHLDVRSPGAFGYRYGQEEEDEVWEIMLYPTPVELQGGSADGDWVFPGFSLDLKPLYEAFDTVDVLYWRPRRASALTIKITPPSRSKASFRGSRFI